MMFSIPRLQQAAAKTASTHAHSQARTVASVPMVINGQIIESKSTEFFDVHNPATGELIAQTPLCTQSEMKEALEGSKEAFKSWRNVAPSNRARIMHKFEGALRDSTDDLCKVITREQGKTIADAAGDVFPIPTFPSDSIRILSLSPRVLKIM